MTWLTQVKNWMANWSIKLVLGLIILTSSWALFSPDFFRVHDYTHGARISEMSRALADGHFPVRWSSNLGFGYGMPLYNFYAPLPYYIGAFFYSFGLEIVLTIKLLFFLSSTITAVGAYLLGRDWFGRWGGILAAAALTLAPYRALSLFIRGALSEAWAIAFLPIILWSMSGVLKGRKSAWGWLVFGLVGLFLSHNITTMLFLIAGLGVGLALLFIEFWAPVKKIDWSRLLKVSWSLISAGLVSFGLAAFYLIPAFLEKDLTKFQATIMTGYFDYRLHFLYIRQFFNPAWMYGGSGWGPNDDISFYLGTGQILAFVFVGCLTIWQIFSRWKKRQFGLTKTIGLVMIGGGLTLMSLFMSLQRASHIWQMISLLSFAQFPWRWMSVGVVGLAVTTAAISVVLPKQWWRGVVLGLVLAIILIDNAPKFRPEEYTSTPLDYYYTEPKKIQQAMSDILPDYIPLQMAKKLTPPPNLWLNPDLTNQDVEVLVNRTHEKLIRIKTLEPVLLDLAVADFPSWQIEIDGQPASKQLGTIGNIAVQVPSGGHLVGVTWVGTQVENLSNWLSFLVASGLALWGFLIAYERKLPVQRTEKNL